MQGDDFGMMFSSMPNSSTKAIIISASDSGYFPHLQGLLASIELHRPPSMQFDLGIIDLGMDASQIEQLRPSVAKIIPGRWDVEFRVQATAPRWFQAQVARPFLRDYFPGYDLYLWLDADTWLQDWRAIELLTADGIGQADDIAIVPEVHWAYPYVYGMGAFRELSYGHVKGSFGEKAADFLDGRAIFNSGVFAIPAQSSVWERWQAHLREGLQISPNKWTEQTALNLAMYGAATKIRILPAWCNWICWHSLPCIDVSRRCLCESTRPFEKLSVIHMTGANKPDLKLSRIDGVPTEIPLDYFGFRNGF